MTRLVLDASVAAKWFLPRAGEPLVDEAFDLLRGYADGRIDFLVPDLFWCEFANILWKAARQGRCSARTAAESLQELQKQGLSTFPASTVISDALALALYVGRPLFDCVYLGLAVAHGVTMITADERLANAGGGRLPIAWLGAARIADSS